MKPIQLPSVQKLNELFKYEDGFLVRKISPTNAVRVGDVAGKTRRDGYRDVRIGGVDYMQHRIIWKMKTGKEPPRYLDHIDGNKANNKIDNLRKIEHGHNNRRSYTHPGTIFVNKYGRYQATIRHLKKQLHIGMYATAYEAQDAIYKYCDEHKIRYD